MHPIIAEKTIDSFKKVYSRSDIPLPATAKKCVCYGVYSSDPPLLLADWQL